MLQIRACDPGTYCCECVHAASAELTCTSWKANCLRSSCESFQAIRSLAKLLTVQPASCQSVLALACHGSAAPMARAHTVKKEWRIFATHLRSLAIRSLVAMLSIH